MKKITVLGSHLMKDNQIIDFHEHWYWYDGEFGPAVEGQAISYDEKNDVYNVIFDSHTVEDEAEKMDVIGKYAKLPSLTNLFPLDSETNSDMDGLDH